MTKENIGTAHKRDCPLEDIEQKHCKSVGVLYTGKDSVPPSRKALLNTLTSRKKFLDGLVVWAKERI